MHEAIKSVLRKHLLTSKWTEDNHDMLAKSIAAGISAQQTDESHCIECEAIGAEKCSTHCIINSGESTSPKPLVPDSAAEEDLEDRAFVAANDKSLPEEAREIIQELWAEVVAREQWRQS